MQQKYTGTRHYFFNIDQAGRLVYHYKWQRVSIARAIVKNPKLLLCDEPTGALDFETSRGVLKLLQTINAQYDTTILMITHNVAIAGMAHAVFKVRSGEIIETTYNKEQLSN